MSSTSSHIDRYIDGRLTELHQLWLMEMTKSERFSTKWYQFDGLQCYGQPIQVKYVFRGRKTHTKMTLSSSCSTVITWTLSKCLKTDLSTLRMSAIISEVRTSGKRRQYLISSGATKCQRFLP